jgi:hypothetical protein
MAMEPPVGASGLFTLAAPFSQDVIPNLTYECKAVRRLVDFTRLGVEPYQEFYAPKSIPSETYENDFRNNVCIVTLVSSMGHWIYVPTSYIQSFPNMNGIAYTALVLAAPIGAIPNYVDLTPVKSKISAVIQETLGLVGVQVQSVAVSPEKNLLQADHNAIEAARQQNILANETDYAKYLREKRRADALALRNQELELYIQQNGV